jgi:chemotaxis protein MotB
MEVRVVTGIGKYQVLFTGLLLLFAAVWPCGCVSSKEYKTRLAEIEGLKGEILSSGEELVRREAENALLKEDVSGLRAELDVLSDREKELIDLNADLKYMLEASRFELTKDLIQAKSGLADKDLRIKQLQDELDVRDVETTRMKARLEELAEKSKKAVEERKSAVSELKDTYDALVSELNDEIEEGRIAVTRLKDKLSLSMVDKILFDSGSAEVKKGGRKVLDRVADILKKATDKQIMIEGHTDNVGIGRLLRERFPTNWELSSQRATNVLRYLQDVAGIDPRLLSASGYAEYRPVDSNETREGRARNRRIEIVLIPLDSDRVTGKGPGGTVE